MTEQLEIETRQRNGEWFWVIAQVVNGARTGKETESSRAFESEDAARADAQCVIASFS